MRSAPTHLGAFVTQRPRSANPTNQVTEIATTTMSRIWRKWSNAHARKRFPIEASAKCRGTRSGVSMMSVSSVVAAADII
jgi:hypothetical protein